MADDFQTLAEKYNNFAAPAMKLYVGSTEVISEQGLVIENLSVSLSASQSGSVHFNVVNAFQLSSRTYMQQIKNTFQLGSTLKVELGYGSNTTSIFQGYISELSLDYGEVPEIAVTALDVRRLLMDTVHQGYVRKVTGYSQAFQELMEGYSAFYDTLEVEATSEELTQLIQKDTDYRFIQEQLCANSDREFIVVGGTVYFRTPKKDKEAVVLLQWGEGLMSFQERKNLCNQTIRVHGRAENKRDNCTVEVTVNTEGSATDFMVIREYQKPALIGEAAIRKYAEQLANKQMGKYNGGSGTCIGLPELMPGVYIQLGNLDSKKPKKYYISSVKHSFGSGGFTTQFDVEGSEA